MGSSISDGYSEARTDLRIIGTSANVVVAGMSERAGKKISFLKFMAYGIPVTLISLTVATPYVLLRYYL
jgi:Na+/H+ antiporter NhaD/arsenite permease-like protein